MKDFMLKVIERTIINGAFALFIGTIAAAFTNSFRFPAILLTIVYLICWIKDDIVIWKNKNN